MAAGKLFHVHIGDNNRLPPGRGMIDFGEILAVLKKIEYSGWMTAELLSRPDADTAAQQTLEHLHRILKGSQ
jgi:sugar phosphate isomerase/epimerase